MARAKHADSRLPGMVERFAEIGGARLRYFVAGAGEPLLLLHGLGGAASNWIELAPALARRRRVLVPDLPGHGGSSALPAARNVAAYADCVGLLAEREGMFPAAVAGHSFGGLVGLRLALRRPGDVRGLVLAAAAGLSTGSFAAKAALAVLGVLRPGRLISPIRGLVAASPLLRTLVFGWWGASDPAALSEQAARGFLAGQALHTDTAAAARALLAEDVRGELARVACPCLVLWGARDNWVPARDAIEYARLLRAQLRTIADCGHLLIGERPDACLDAIESFLDGIRELDELPLQSEALSEP